jgi:hypothetical protein
MMLTAGDLCNVIGKSCNDCRCAVLLQHLLEGAGIGYTGVTADYALNCCNRVTLHKVRTTRTKCAQGSLFQNPSLLMTCTTRQYWLLRPESLS